MEASQTPLTWSAQYAISASSPQASRLPGDKILLPDSALQQLLDAAPIVNLTDDATLTRGYDPFNPYTHAAEVAAREQAAQRQQQLPAILTFRLVNPENGRAAYAGVREFSAPEGEAVLSPYLQEALGFSEANKKSTAGNEDIEMTNGSATSNLRVTLHFRELPKGTYVKLRPLEAGYDADDWKAVLEQHIRNNYTTLTQGQVLSVPGAADETFQFLLDEFKPMGSGICVIDTDLEVDIEALDEEQARETMKRIAAKIHKAPGTARGSSTGGKLESSKIEEGQILVGEYVDYELTGWDRTKGIEVELTLADEEDEIDLLASPFGRLQRAHPRVEEHVFGEFDDRPSKRLRISPSNVELDHAESLYISVHATSVPKPDPSPTSPIGEGTPKRYTIRAQTFDFPKVNGSATETADSDGPLNSTDVQCKNCKSWIPKQTLPMHEAFCYRNNILCPRGCGQIFQKRSALYSSHWHCPHDSLYGNTPSSQTKHNHLYHTPTPCPFCSTPGTFRSKLDLARHRTSTCPAKLILCQFCHLAVPQGGDPTAPPDPEVIVSGLTPHEYADGARTTECHLCDKITRLRDMPTHLKLHEREKTDRPAPRLCRNENCGRTLDGTSPQGDTRLNSRRGLAGGGGGNDIGLCTVCFGPLYVSMYDPDGKALTRRIERRYITQLNTGCNKAWCGNEYCRAGRTHVDIAPAQVPTKDAIAMVKPFVQGALGGETPLHFCVDETSQQRRQMGRYLAAETQAQEGMGGWTEEWCVGALEGVGGDVHRAKEWLKGFASQRDER